MSSQPSLLDVAARTVADTSLEAYQRIVLTLQVRERAVLMALSDLCERYGDATGGEVAEHLGTLTTTVRPRLTGLEDRGLVVRTAARASRAKYEGKCHGYKLALPRAAVARMQAKAR